MKNKINDIYYKGNNFQFNICKSYCKKIVSGGLKSDFFSKMSITGGGYRETYSCYKCFSKDRTRLIYYFIENMYKVKSNIKVLHVAPEEKIKDLFLTNKNLYIRTDLNSTNVDINQDITNIIFRDNIFDLVLCNHVLEHVKDENLVLKELYRIIKKGGKLIIQVPIAKKLEKKIEQKPNWSDNDRLINFGQKDHVRLHGMDFPKRLKKPCFKVKIFRWWKQKNREDLKKYGFIENDEVFICSK